MLALAVTMAGCVDRESQQQAKRTQENLNDKSVLVQTLPVRESQLQNTIEVTGQFVAGLDAQVGAKIGGRLVSVLVKDGDPVQAGQVVARQETTDLGPRVRQATAAVSAARAQYNQALATAKQGPQRTSAGLQAAEARLKQARASLEKIRSGARTEERKQARAAVEAARTGMEVARKEMERDIELLAQGAISQSQADRSRAAYAASLAQYEQAMEGERILTNGARTEDITAVEQEVRAAEQAVRSERANKALDVQFTYAVQSARAALDGALEQLALAQSAMSDANIRSPFSGTVSGRPMQAGTYAGPGTPILRVVDTGSVYFEADVTEDQVSEMTTGLAVQISVKSSSRDPIPGRVVAVNPVATQTGRLFKVRISVEAAGVVKAGMFGTASIQLGTPVQAITVPMSAVLGSGSDRYVFVIQKLKAVRKDVAVVSQRDGQLQVEGIQPGEALVIEGQTSLRPGAEVKLDAPAKESKG